MFSQLLNEIKQMDCVADIYTNRKGTIFIFLDKLVFDMKFITVKLTFVDDSHWELTDDGFIAQELNSFYGRNILSEKFVKSKIKEMKGNIDVNFDDKTTVIFNSGKFNINTYQKTCSVFFKNLIEFVDYIERGKNEISR